MTKEELALELIQRLKQEYPEAGCTLDYNQAWKLLVSVRLAAQCTDARVNVVVEGLYDRYPDVKSLAEAPVEEIEKIVRPCGLGKSKARDISACMKMLQEDYHGMVPEDFDALLKLPGVGRKSANLIMGDVFHKPAIGGKCQRSQKGGNAFMEADSPGGRKRFLSSSGVSWQRRVHCEDQSSLRPMLRPGYLCPQWGGSEEINDVKTLI